MDTMIDLKCEDCGVDYQKPERFKTYNDQYPTVFFKWSLTFCNPCRKKKEVCALKNLPQIISDLQKISEESEGNK
jgi:hypothetical protein